jgi:hypothetical protein
MTEPHMDVEAEFYHPLPPYSSECNMYEDKDCLQKTHKSITNIHFHNRKQSAVFRNTCSNKPFGKKVNTLYFVVETELFCKSIVTKLAKDDG